MSFAALDDLLLATDHMDLREIRDGLAKAPFDSLGSIVECDRLRVGFSNLIPQLTSLPDNRFAAELGETLEARRCNRNFNSTSLSAKDVEICWIPGSTAIGADPTWTAFRMRFQRASEESGFRKPISQGFVGALDEMVSNVIEHSNSAESGIVGYSVCSDGFEYVVADSGVGVLNSLHFNPEYRTVADSGTALTVALSDGESRFGTSSRRGYGFRQIFKSLIGLGADLRFRSGDYRLRFRKSPRSFHLHVFQNPLNSRAFSFP